MHVKILIPLPVHKGLLQYRKDSSLAAWRQHNDITHHAFDVHRLEETFGKGSLPSDAMVSKSIKAASKRKEWTHDRAQGNVKSVFDTTGFKVGRRHAMEEARARLSKPVATEIRRKLYATNMIRQEIEV